MSEDLSNYKAATSIEQNSTQEKNFPPFHLSLSIGSLLFQCSLVEGHIHAGVIEKPVTHENLAEDQNCNWDFPVNICQNTNPAFSVEDVQRIIENHATEASLILEPTQKELSVHSSSGPEVAEDKPSQEKYGQIVFGDPDWVRGWNSISAHPRLKWKTEGEVLYCSYSSSRLKTTWEEVDRLSKLDYKQRGGETRKIVGNDANYNLRTCLSLLVRLYAEGKIKRPVKKAERKARAADVPKMVTPTDPRKLPKVK